MIKTYLRFSLATGVIGVLISLSTIALPGPKAQALTGSEFQAGRIIDDSIFYNPNTMSVQQIQDFLQAKAPTCDTQGLQPRGSTTRAAYGTSVGNPPPYVCLKDFRQDTTYKAPEAGLCNGYGVSNRSAADIIYTVAQSCGISPKVLLVLLQKEQALVTDDWPWPIQYRAATGYGCPDTAECDSQFYGFFNQVYAAARGYKYYAKFPNSFNYIAGRNNYIQYNPSTNCGGSTIFIQNQATAGLYNYTPYQPNASALSNLYGSGDSCGAYGNRNFWRLFNDWFGSTTDNIPTSYTVRLVSPITLSPVSPIAGEPTTVSYTVKNFGTQAVSYQTSVLQCRLNPSTPCDPPYDPAITLAAGEERVFTTNLSTMQTGGAYTLTPYFLQDGVWYRYSSDIANGSSLSLTIPGVRLVAPITTSPANPSAGESVNVTYTVKNFGILPVRYQTSVLQCRLNTSINCDPSYDSPFTLQPNEQRSFSTTLPAVQGGTYNLTPYFQYNDVFYKYGTWGSVNATTLSLQVPDVRLTGPISSSPTQPIPGQPVTVTYTVRNFSANTVTHQSSVLQCRFNSFTNCDPTPESPLTLAANEQRTFTASLPATKAGIYTLIPYFLQDNRWYKYSLGTASSNQLRLDVPAYVAPMELVGPITSSPAQPIPGQPITVSYTVKNAGSLPAIYQTSVLQCRFNTNTNCDPEYDAPLTIDAGAQRTFTVSFPAARAGTYILTPYYSQNDKYHRYANGTASSNTLRIDVPAYVAPMELVGPITTSPVSPIAGQAFTASYTVRNTGSLPAIYQTSILQCRLNTATICDPANDAPLTIDAGAQRTFTVSFPAAQSGAYVLKPFYNQNNTWYAYTSPGTSNSLRVTVP